MTNLFWKGTTIRVSKFRVWLVSLVIPKRIQKVWIEEDKLKDKLLTAYREKYGLFG